MTFWILPKSGIPISCDTVQRVTRAEMQTDEVRNEMREWSDSARRILDAKAGDNTKVVESATRRNIFDLEHEQDGFLEEYCRVISDPSLKEEDEHRLNRQGTNVEDEVIETESDPYVNMTVNLRRAGEGPAQRATVMKRKRDDEGRLIGKADPHNPLLDTRLYEVEYADGSRETLAANILAENILAQVDEDGHRHLMMEELSDHRRGPEAIPKSKETFKTAHGSTEGENH